MPSYEPIYIEPRYDSINNVYRPGYWLRKEATRRVVLTTASHRDVLLGRIARARAEGRGAR